MEYCIPVVKIVQDYIISGFLPNIDIPCALTIRSYFLQSKVVLFLFLVVFPFLFWLGFFNYFFVFFVFFYLFFGGEGGSQWLYECTFLHTNLLQSHISKLMYSFYFTYYLCFTAISKLF